MGKFVCNFISYALKRTVDITVVVPTPTLTDGFTLETDPTAPISHKPQHKYPVLYLLHGMGNNHATWTGYTNVEMYAEEQIQHRVFMLGLVANRGRGVCFQCKTIGQSGSGDYHGNVHGAF